MLHPVCFIVYLIGNYPKIEKPPNLLRKNPLWVLSHIFMALVGVETMPPHCDQLLVYIPNMTKEQRSSAHNSLHHFT